MPPGTELPAWHLVAGSTGAGKTTYARGLTQRLGGICFSIDEWMNTLFWPDCPEKDNFPWAIERVRRCEAQAAEVAAQLIRSGVSSVLDMGLTTRAQREGWLDRAQAAGVRIELHLLDLPPALRWQRVQQRNAAAEGTFVFTVTRAMFDSLEQIWELPLAGESTRYRNVHWIAE